jgi:hypothetical protein
MNGQPIRPSRWWYGVALLVLLAGSALSIVFIVRNIVRMSSGLQRVVVPGEGEIALKARGRYEIYYEHHSAIGDRVFMTGEDFPGLECRLVPKGSIVKVPLAPTSGTTTYEWGGHAGKAILGFRIDRPGEYVLSASYPRGRAGPDIVLAVGQGSVGGTLLAIFGGLAGIFGSFIVAVVIVGVTLVKRSKAKHRAAGQPA